MRPTVLILSAPNDIHAYAVAEALVRKGGSPLVWCTPDYPSQSEETIHVDAGRLKIVLRGPDFELVDPSFTTIWRRRPSHSKAPSAIHPADRVFAELECAAFRRGLLSSLSASSFWVNPHEAGIRSSYKIVQQFHACRVGMRTPTTLYSNDPQEVREFIRANRGRIVFKPLQGIPWKSDDKIWMPFTNILTEEKLVDDVLLRAAPGIYQELIPKAYELRVTIMGRCVLAARIDSQQDEATSLDWRRGGVDLRMEPCPIPESLATLCLDLMERLGIVFGCFDFIVTPDGEYVFLEVNEMGQFLFLERSAGLPLLDAFSDFLLAARPDFSWTPSRVSLHYNDVLETARAAMAASSSRHVSSPDHSVEEKSSHAASQVSS